MKVLVIGAAGKTGRAVVEQAVAAGHQVTAFVHKADEYEVSDVRVIEGDATDSATMDAAVLGQDAVLVTRLAAKRLTRQLRSNRAPLTQSSLPCSETMCAVWW